MIKCEIFLIHVNNNCKKFFARLRFVRFVQETKCGTKIARFATAWTTHQPVEALTRIFSMFSN
jgi:hypothetical protein